MTRAFVGGCVLMVAWLGAATAACAMTVLAYPRSESENNTQYVYDYELLRKALDATVASHGPYELRPSELPMNQARAGDEIAAGSGMANVFARSTAIEHEQRFLPVRIPLGMIADGSFEAHFQRYKGPLIARARLKSRKAFRIDNPYMSPETRAMRKTRPELWYDAGK